MLLHDLRLAVRNLARPAGVRRDGDPAARARRRRQRRGVLGGARRAAAAAAVRAAGRAGGGLARTSSCRTTRWASGANGRRSFERIAGVAPGWLMALAAEGGEPLKVTGARVVGQPVHDARHRRPRSAARSCPATASPAASASRASRIGCGGSASAPTRHRSGASVLVDQVPHEVVGVMPPASRCSAGAPSSGCRCPSRRAPPRNGRRSPRASRGCAPARPRPSASRELASLVPEMRRTLGLPDDWGRTLHAESLQGTTTEAVRPALTLLLAAVGLVLLLGAVNLGTLVLGRSIERARELAVRTAVGASRRQLLRQLLVEQAVLATAGALAGLALAQALLPLLLARHAPRSAAPGRDRARRRRVRRRAGGVGRPRRRDGAACPRCWRCVPGLQPLLRQHAGHRHAGRQRALGGLVAAQVALALVLGIGAGADAALDVEPAARRSGLRSRRRARLPPADHVQVPHARRAALPYLQQAGERLAALPGVAAVGAIGHLPMSGYSWTIAVHRQDRPPAPGASPSAGGLAVRLGRLLRGDAHSAARRAAVRQRRRHRRRRWWR